MTSQAGRIITITSGMRDVGKSSNTYNIGLALARQGKRVCIVNTESSLSKSNMLEQFPGYLLEHVVSSVEPARKKIPGKNDLFLVSAGINSFDYLYKTSKQNQYSFDAVMSLKDEFDYVLIDTAACINKLVLKYINSSHKCLFVISSDPESLSDSYSLLKYLFNSKICKKTDFVVKFSHNENHAMNVFSSFSSAVKKYMNYRMNYLGYIINEDFNVSSESTQGAPLSRGGNDKSGECFNTIAHNLHTSLDESFAGFNQDSCSGAQGRLTMRILADKYQEIFRTMPFKKLSNEIKDINQAQAINSLKLKTYAKEVIRDESCVDSQWQDYLGGIHLASLLGDYTEASQDGSY